MPLQIDVPEEHPDVTALKKRVKEVAEQYTARHGWCREVRAALREAGITGDGDQIAVEITFTVAGSEEQKATQTFPVSQLAGKTDEEQKAVVAEKVAPKVMVAGTAVTIPVTINDLNKVDLGELARNGLNYPEGYIHFYSSNQGRVAHLAATPGAVLRGELSAVEYVRRNSNQMYTLCGERTWGATQNSTRAENRVCANCSRRAVPAQSAAS